LSKVATATAFLSLVFALIHGIAIAQSIPLISDTPRCIEPEFKDPDRMVLPKYPENALQNNTDTAIELRGVVHADGTSKITGPSESNEFARASLEAVRKWRFHPSMVDGKPVETVYRIQIHFNSILREAVPRIEVVSPQPQAPKLTDEEVSDEVVYKFSDPDIVKPKTTYQVEPEFTDKARKLQESGDVMLSVVVGTDGRAHDIHVECSSVPDLNQQAIESVKLWKFEPGTKDRQPVPVKIEVDTSFRMY
jgi:TonB family protein